MSFSSKWRKRLGRGWQAKPRRVLHHPAILAVALAEHAFDGIEADPAPPPERVRLVLCPNASDRGCRGEATDPHSCPYLSEINNDDQTECRCCDACRQECGLDI